MSRLMIFYFVFLGFVFPDVLSLPAADLGPEAFPEMNEWTKKGSPALYSPDRLFEYIDGAAEVFLSFGFQELASLSYEDKEKHVLIADIYLHDSDNNGFGIYCQEKPRQGDFLKIGTEGYYEKGNLNFFQGKFYVKLSSFDLKDDEMVLKKMAGEISRKLPAGHGFPPVLDCFPPKNLVNRSLRYISQTYLGHAFLHSAFVGDYEETSEKMEVFIIQGVDPEDVRKMVAEYKLLVNKKGLSILEKDGLIQLEDPYYKQRGKIIIKFSGKILWGILTRSTERGKYYLQEIERLLKFQKIL